MFTIGDPSMMHTPTASFPIVRWKGEWREGACFADLPPVEQVKSFCGDASYHTKMLKTSGYAIITLLAISCLEIELLKK